jgi:adenine C2-methylase RlmN of 23S rRNA A2503 and tRNA A37
MKVIESENEKVLKFVHNDGSETAIKYQHSCSHNEDLSTKLKDRNKFTVFISTSVGCFMNCSFCHLTIKKSKYIPLSEDRVFKNVTDAISEAVERNPHLKDSYIKLSWMGMGDALIESKKVKDVSLKVLDWGLDLGAFKGLDGVDLSTVFPEGVKNRWEFEFGELNSLLKKYPSNPNNKISVQNSDGNISEQYKDRSPFRLFYSLGSLDEEIKKKIIPNSVSTKQAVEQLKKGVRGYNLIFHHVLLDGQNDSDREVANLCNFIKDNPENELRILRYNKADENTVETEKLKNIISNLKEHTDKLKIQISPGDSVMAACGQFIVNG